MTQQSISDDTLLDSIISEIGADAFQEQFREFLSHTNEIAMRNHDLSVASNVTEEDYDTLVSQIIIATNDYYKFIGKLPEKVRKYLSAAFTTADIPDDSVRENLSNLTGLQLDKLPSSMLSVQSIRPQKYIMQIDAITNHLVTLGDINTINVGHKGSQPINTTVTLDIPDHMKIEGGGQLSTYDKSIINGVTSLIESGNTVFSVPMLYHAMTGKQNPTVDDQLADEICTKLERMRRMMITIDLSEESSARFFTDEMGEQLQIENLSIDGYLMPLNRIHGTINGKTANLYQILQHPPLYSYSKMKRQLASVPIFLLGAPVNNNSTTIPLKTYLLQRIELMKNKKNCIVSPTILYDSIYEELGAETATKVKKLRIRTYTSTILEYFVEHNYIKSYAPFKKGRTMAGIKIEI